MDINNVYAVLHYQGAPDAEPTTQASQSVQNLLQEYQLAALENPGAPGGSAPADRVIDLQFNNEVRNGRLMVRHISCMTSLGANAIISGSLMESLTSRRTFLLSWTLLRMDLALKVTSPPQSTHLSWTEMRLLNLLSMVRRMVRFIQLVHTSVNG